MHFQYELTGPHHSRIFNDIITLFQYLIFSLKNDNCLIKLSISHGLAQSAKLRFYSFIIRQFEDIMERTIEGAIEFPSQLAEHGEVKLERLEVVKTIGKLFDLRMGVNLVSNVLDIPDMFWLESELQGYYEAIRGIFLLTKVYFEISQRTVLLNKRADVLSDLLELLSDHHAHDEGTRQNIIIILLVAICLVIAVLEIAMKIFRLESERKNDSF